MKSYLPFIVLLLVSGILGAETPAQREFQKLTTERDLATRQALKPINDRYAAALALLLDKATKSGDLEAANQVQAALAKVRNDLTPAQVVGKWQSTGPTGGQGTFTFHEDGSAEFLFPNGKVNPNEWRIRDGKLLVSTTDKKFTITYELDGEILRGRSGDGKDGFTAKKLP